MTRRLGPHHRQPAAPKRALYWLPVLPIPQQLHGVVSRFLLDEEEKRQVSAEFFE